MTGGASAQSPQHAYTAPGTYQWGGTAVQDGATCSKGGTITVSPESGDGFRAMLVASHGRGKHETGWRTDLVLFNPGASPAPVQVGFKAEGHVIQRSLALAAENIREWIDVVEGWFGATGCTTSRRRTARTALPRWPGAAPVAPGEGRSPIAFPFPPSSAVHS